VTPAAYPRVALNDGLLHRRGRLLTCVNALSEPGRLSPPIWPCTTRGFPCLRCCHRSGGLLPHLFTLAKLSERFEDVPQVFLRDATVLLSAGGIFSVALSVNSSTGFSLCAFSSRTLQNSHRGKNAAQTQVCATAPLALPGALPYFVTGSCEPTTTVSGLSSRPAILQWPSQRSPGSPASTIVSRYDADNLEVANRMWLTAKTRAPARRNLRIDQIVREKQKIVPFQ
jgi:hypothetical protein